MRAEDLLQTYTAYYRGTAEMYVAGELDLATAPLLQQAVTKVLNTRPRSLLLDLSGLTFCDHTGLHTLHHLTHQAHTTHTPLRLTGIHPRLHRTLTPQHTPPTPHTPTTLRY